MPESAAGRDPWVMVATGFHQRGGMEKANAALAEHLLEQGVPLHMVGHEVDARLADRPGAVVHRVPRPAGSFLVGERLLERAGRAVARRVTSEHPGARVLVNGGNCRWPDVNWVHSVHHAWPCVDEGAPAWFRAKNRLMKSSARRRERRVVGEARVVLANSEKTRRDLVRHLGVDPERVHVVYLGADPAWGLVQPHERAAARAWLELAGDRPVAAFVGALGHDRGKGFDLLLEAWSRLCADPAWDGQLVAAGGGRGLERWRGEVERRGLAGRVRLLGFTDRVGDLLAAADLLVSPTRYDAYGLAVQEAVCRGVPALVSAHAGVAERYPEALREMVLPDPADVDDMVARLRGWRADPERWRSAFRPLGEELRAHTWRDMARSVVSVVSGSRVGP
ncbi:MAG TPA: glycosyltransferase family 4 protein [Longimicrobiaceae bacterium]|nr:glycosyltransferase family 4 protein [Longimicrobiaceae bacterium]